MFQKSNFVTGLSISKASFGNMLTQVMGVIMVRDICGGNCAKRNDWVGWGEKSEPEAKYHQRKEIQIKY